MPLRRFLLVLSVGLTLVATPSRAQDAAAPADAVTPIPTGARYQERAFRMPIPGSLPAGLDVLEVYVNTPGKHPLALLTHGTSNDPVERAGLTPWMQLQQAMWFARRGFVALVIIRKGYGNSGGDSDRTNGGCSSRGSFEQAGEASAVDLRAAVKYAEANLPEADTTNVISAGVSTGGFAQVALVADPPPGLKAAISFAGGRGGDGKEHLCDECGLEEAFKAFGKHANTPMLWIYSENDHWFPPRYAKKFEAAFQSGGGKDEFVLAPPDGEDGHHLYSHVAAWSATVDSFLNAHKLLPLDAPYPMPKPPKVTPPAGLSARGLEGFNTFLLSGPHKAFATNGQGPYAFSSGQMTQELADQHALENCRKFVKAGAPCVIAARGQ
jgi:dienelactone hydrolase